MQAYTWRSAYSGLREDAVLRIITLSRFYGNSGAGGVHNESCTNIEVIGVHEAEEIGCWEVNCSYN